MVHRVDSLEAKVSALLEARLRGANTAEEMFRVFAKFNPLFVRPRCGHLLKNIMWTLVVKHAI